MNRLFASLLLATLVLSVPAAYVLKGISWATSPVPFYVNADTPDIPATAAFAGIKAGSLVWGQQSKAAIALTYAGPTTGTAVMANGKNEVFFRNETNGAAIATTYSFSSNGRITDFDLVIWDAPYRFFVGTAGCTGGFYLEDILAHEFGHALGLGHSEVSAATMYYGVGYCAQGTRTLDADDMAAIQAVYPPRSGSPPPPPPLPPPPPTDILPAAPTNLVLSAGHGNAPGTLMWIDHATNEQAFVVERLTSGTWQPLAQVGQNVTAYVDASMQRRVTYTYRVRAKNGWGVSSPTNTVSGSRR